GGFKQRHDLVGTVVEGRIAQHEADLVRIGRQQLLDPRVEGAAGFASGVEKLDDDDRRLGLAQGRRVHADQGGAVGFGDLAGLLLLLRRVVEGSAGKDQQQDGQGGDEEGFLVHRELRRRAASSSAVMVRKARTESSGMVRKPNQVTTVVEQGTPCVQGLMLSGMTPITSNWWKTAIRAPSPASGRA